VPDRSSAERHLAQAERHISETEGRITRQADIVRRLRALGDEPHAVRAMELLHVLQETLATMNYHRDLILRELAES